MKKSKVETAETRRRIISTASRLFMERGLGETGIADVMAAAGLTQGGFYRHFESKEQLVRYYDEAIAGHGPMEAMDIIVGLYLHQFGKDGLRQLCPLANLGSELHHANEHIRAVAMEGYRSLAAAFAHMMGQLGIADHASVAEAIVATIVGAVTLSRLSVDAAVSKNILDNAQATVRT